MKKLITAIFLFLFFTVPFKMLEAHAETADYLSYSEIMLSSGKLIRYYTVDELKELYKKTDGVHLYSIVIYIDNKAVDGSYISNTLYSVDNTSATDIEYTLEYTIETNNKVSFQTAGQLSAGASGTIKKVKAEAAGKASIDYSKTTTKSVKEKRTMKLVVEANSRLIVYLTGEVTVTNGVVSVYYMFHKAYTGAFEFVTLKSQFSKLEKRSI